MSIHLEVLLATGYASFLLLLALGIEWFARFSHQRVHAAKTVGFEFHPHLPAWQCPRGNFLWLEEIDQKARLARYRAPARVCNECPIKLLCTDSNQGRELLQPLGEWLDTEMGRFHRVISLTLLLLAALALAIALVRHPHGREAGLIAAFFAALLPTTGRLLGTLRLRAGAVGYELPMRIPARKTSAPPTIT